LKRLSFCGTKHRPGDECADASYRVSDDAFTDAYAEVRNYVQVELPGVVIHQLSGRLAAIAQRRGNNSLYFKFKKLSCLRTNVLNPVVSSRRVRLSLSNVPFDTICSIRDMDGR
jgi:hypothetical protein